MIGGPYQSKLTPYTGLPESTPTFTLSLMEVLPQLIKNGLIFTDLLWVCSQFALNFFHFYFNHKFHTQGDIFWKKLLWEHILESFKLSESVSTFILSWKLSLPDLICPQKPGGKFRARNCLFLQFFVGHNLTLFTFCQFVTWRSHQSPFYHFEGMKGHWPGFPKTP